MGQYILTHFSKKTKNKFKRKVIKIMTEQQVREENEMANRIARKILGSVCPSFGTGGVPTKVAAKVMGKSETWVREGIRTGLLPIGVVTAAGSQQCANIYISPKLFWEFTGFVYESDKEKS